MKHLSTLFLLISCSFLYAQHSISAKIVDSLTQKPIPYVTISVNQTYGVISNTNGKFALYLGNKITPLDSLKVQCMGYASKTFPVQFFTDSIIKLSPQLESLKEVLITDKKFSVDEVIEKVKINLNGNYDYDLTKKKLFFRKSFFTTFKKNEVAVKKTTIPEFNQNLADSLVRDMPKYTEYYTEVLANTYGKSEENASDHKIDIIKASELYDKDSELTFENYEQKLNDVVKKRIKRDSYFKIKTGIIGFKTDVDSLFEFDDTRDKQSQEFIAAQKEKETNRKKRFSKYIKNEIVVRQNASFTISDSDFDFLQKPNKYNFKIEDINFLNEMLIYKISFSPKGNKDYEGSIYVNVDDFAIVRMDYVNVQPLKNFSLFGIGYKYYLNKGTLIYKKTKAKKYALKYAEVYTGNRIDFDRPIKIIEKNKHTKGRRKQNELSADIHFIVLDEEKSELVVFENNIIPETEFNNFKEVPNVLPVYLNEYDPEFWKGYNIIEPNQAILEFKSLESQIRPVK